MNEFNGKLHIVNWKLLSFVGLDQILSPRTVKVLGYSVYHWMIMAYCTFIMVITVMSLIGLFVWEKKIATIILYVDYMINNVMVVYKLLHIVYFAEKLRKYFKVSSMDFTSCYNSAIFRKWQTRSTKLCLLSVIMGATALTFVSLSPFVLHNFILRIKNVDGSWNAYRLNVFNFYFMVSDETYNKYFYIFYCLELTCVLFGIPSMVLFDSIIITMCFSISCHIEMIGHAIQSIGHKSSSLSSLSKDSITTVSNMQILLREECDVCDELIIMIQDHQKVLKVLKNFYNTYHLPTLLQLCMVSYAHILLWFLVAKINLNGDYMEYYMSFKAIFVLPMFSLQLFILCYSFQNVNDNLESFTFALYSTNWTEMNRKSQTLVLLTIAVNKTLNIVMKFTNTKIVNLTLYAATIRLCYSIFSTLLNYNKTLSN